MIIVSVFMKHDDRATMVLKERGGAVLAESEGYLPSAGIFGGDDTELEIDNETGRILNWKPITVAEIKGDESNTD